MTVDSQRSASTVHTDRIAPVIVLTAQHGESEEKALDLGAHDYLTKPVQTRSLVARVRAVLKRVNS
jgi:DNA-binding response OmpR family regulator